MRSGRIFRGDEGAADSEDDDGWCIACAARKMPSLATASELSSQFTFFDLRLNRNGADFRIFLVFTGAGIECIRVPRANHFTALDRSFTKRAALVRTGSIENTDLSMHVGDTDGAAADHKLSQSARRRQLDFRTNSYKVRHDHLSLRCCAPRRDRDGPISINL